MSWFNFSNSVSIDVLSLIKQLESLGNRQRDLNLSYSIENNFYDKKGRNNSVWSHFHTYQKRYWDKFGV